MTRPKHEVRAAFDDETVRVYQAYRPEIADAAVRAQAFVPPFKRERMTWIKPSFTWMMYRSGWGVKEGQERVLAIDMSREGFEAALAMACLSSFDRHVYESRDEWKAMLRSSPVRIQWDPERSIALEELEWRAIQIGLGGRAAVTYADAWVRRITDVSPLAREVHAAVSDGELERARRLVPDETPYPLAPEIARRVGCRG
jgi:hypothetical protein